MQLVIGFLYYNIMSPANDAVVKCKCKWRKSNCEVHDV